MSKMACSSGHSADRSVDPVGTLASPLVEAPPASGMNCLGWLSRDSGHNLVPVPPQIMTGVIKLDVIGPPSMRWHANP